MRLITRSDFDGLVCAVLLQEVEQIDAVEFVHPKDVQDGKIAVGPNDILTNLPYQQGIGLWFDHHSSEIIRNQDTVSYRGRFEIAPSAARVCARRKEVNSSFTSWRTFGSIFAHVSCLFASFVRGVSPLFSASRRAGA